MSTVTLIRHGQVASFETDGDRLSSNGELQARALGEWWIRHGVEFDEVYSGTLGRHIATERAVARVFVEHGKSWRQAEAREGWNEYDAHGALRGIDHSQLGAAVFQCKFEAAMLRWLEGDIGPESNPGPNFETACERNWPASRARAAGNGVAVFTSGGPIGLCVQTALVSSGLSQ